MIHHVTPVSEKPRSGGFPDSTPAMSPERHSRRATASVHGTGPITLALVLLLASAGVVFAAQDVVITTSGDKLVGEIKKVEKDVLIFSTDYSDSDFKIKWEKIASIESTRQFVIETFDGQRLSGSLKPDPEKKPLVQVAETSVKLPDVSTVQPFEQKFLSRIDAGLDFGYSLTRTNSAAQLSLASNLSYRDEHHARRCEVRNQLRQRTRDHDFVVEVALDPLGNDSRCAVLGVRDLLRADALRDASSRTCEAINGHAR